MTNDLKVKMIDCEAEAITMDIELDKLEIENQLPYSASTQDRSFINVIIDGHELCIGSDKCNATILELFEDIVYDRQVIKITKYFEAKYPHVSCLTLEQAQLELVDLRLPLNEPYFEFVEIAQIIAEDVVR